MEIELVAQPSRNEFINKWVKPGIPVLINGVANNWPAMGKWTPEFFGQIGGRRKARIEFGNVLHDNPYFEEWELGRYFEKITESPKISTELNPSKNAAIPYLAYFDIFKFFPELYKDVDFSYWHGRVKVPIGWIGPPGSFTGLHYDVAPNLFIQFYGRKEFVLYPPSQSKLLYKSRRYDFGFVLSDVDTRIANDNRFPLFSEAKGIKVVVEPGQILFTPTGWWHQVRGLETSISVSCFGFGILDLIFQGVPEILKYSLHSVGLYRKNECACHIRKAFKK